MVFYMPSIRRKVIVSLQLLAVLAMLAGFGYANAYLYTPVLSPILFCGILITVYATQRVEGRTFADLGFRLKDLPRNGLPLLGISLVVAAAGAFFWSRYFPVSKDFYKDSDFWYKLLLQYPVWALLQQYLVLGFFFNRFETLFAGRFKAVACITTPVLFALMHFPNYPLMISCLVFGVIWTLHYNRYRNLLAVAGSHAVLGTIASHILLMYCAVGFDADPERWTKTRPAAYALDTVNDIIAVEDNYPVAIDPHATSSILVTGWAYGNQGRIENVFVCVQGQKYKAEYGLVREDAAAYLGTPSTPHLGYQAEIPVQHLREGTSPLSLRIQLANRRFLHRPGKKVWIRILEK